jgi:hypothetical protein
MLLVLSKMNLIFPFGNVSRGTKVNTTGSIKKFQTCSCFKLKSWNFLLQINIIIAIVIVKINYVKEYSDHTTSRSSSKS